MTKPGPLRAFNCGSSSAKAHELSPAQQSPTCPLAPSPTNASLSIALTGGSSVMAHELEPAPHNPSHPHASPLPCAAASTRLTGAGGVLACKIEPAPHSHSSIDASSHLNEAFRPKELGLRRRHHCTAPNSASLLHGVGRLATAGAASPRSRTDPLHAAGLVTAGAAAAGEAIARCVTAAAERLWKTVGPVTAETGVAGGHAEAAGNCWQGLGRRQGGGRGGACGAAAVKERGAGKAGCALPHR